LGVDLRYEVIIYKEKKMKNKNLFYGILFALSALSFQAHAQSSPDCSDPSKKDGKDSTCATGVGLTGPTPQTRNFQTQSIKPFAVAGQSCVTPWGDPVPDNTGVAAFNQQYGTYDPSTGQYAADCLEEERHCTNGILSGTYQYKTCTIPPVNGACGPANGAYYTYPSSGPAFADQCNPSYTYGGNAPSSDAPPSVPASSGVYFSNNTYSWTCAGEMGGSTASCSAYLRINAQCGSGVNSCDLGNSGNASSYNVYYPYTCGCVTTCVNNPTTYTCVNDPAPATTQTCTADPITQTCTTSGCTTCYAYWYTVYNWTCYGINGGSNASCSVSQ
jgi:hypothetical protein